jgi:DNA-binding transcriptional MerR regulator
LPEKRDDARLYGIGAVSRLTGLTDHTIRVWERRYAAIVTARAPNGRRQYTEADVQKLALLKRLTDHGIAIGRIAGDAIDDLRAQLERLRELAAGAEPRALRVAVLGDFLPRQLREHGQGPASLDIRVADNSHERFTADLRQQPVDVVVLERPVLDAESLAEIRQYLDGSSAAQGVIVYSFGRTRDLAAAANDGIVALRAPVGPEELRDAAMRAARAGHPPGPDTRPPDTATLAPELSGPVAARRFNPQQLANLAAARNGVDCECPRHLVQLVSDLSAFEIYSDRCANRDDEDAALHRYLHRTTAEARALVERALERLADADDLEY